MIDVSNYEKVGECRDGKMKWLSQDKTNIVYLIMFGNESYVGSSKDIRRRFSQYIPALKRGKYEAEKVQNAFNLSKGFDVYAIEYTDSISLRKKEEFYLGEISPSLNTRTHAGAKKDKSGLKFMDIKNIAREKGMTMEQVAAKMGISKGGLSKALNGNPTLKTLRAVAEVLQVSVTDFFRDEDKQSGLDAKVETPQREIVVTCDKCGNVMKFRLVEE